MNCLYLTLLALIAAFPQAKGFCGKRRETQAYLIYSNVPSTSRYLHYNDTAVNQAVHKTTSQALPVLRQDFVYSEKGYFHTFRI